ncbi:MAG TPA: VWA domain-containing protein [Vicinamibacterales bacterium]|nr:VWA domain-containing protein [Vicinamibacterales bacterium]
MVPLQLILGLLAAVASGQEPQVPRHRERVDVARVLIDVRVLDGEGRPVRDLEAADFRVRVDGRPARVESADWVGAAAAPPPAPGATRRAHPFDPREEPQGRLVVFLFQKDLEPSRIVGLMRMLIETRTFLDSLGPEDRVAVLSFDSHLKVWLDFTRDLDQVREVLHRGILFRRPPPIAPVASPSLMATLDVVRARRAYSMEDALALLGQALEPIPHSKSVVLVGHGFGRLAGPSILIEASYGEARRALQAARASVFALDTTNADAHTLEAGLQMTARDTGGFFERTHLHPRRAIARLAGALEGHYVLFVEVSTSLDREWHEIDVRLVRGKKGTVLAKRHY